MHRETPTTASPSQGRRAEEERLREELSAQGRDLPVGIREGQEAKLAGAVDDEILGHLAEVDHQQGGSREEFHCRQGRKSGGGKGAWTTQGTLTGALVPNDGFQPPC